MRLFIPRQPLNHITPLPRSLWDSEVVGWVVRYEWLNEKNAFVRILHAQCIEGIGASLLKVSAMLYAPIIPANTSH